jgi:aspartate/methionine/tyrosine aminotransferase
MSRPRFEHLAWSKAHSGRHAHDLADSAVAPPDLAALGLPHSVSLPHGGYASALPALERALAERLGAPGGRVLVTAGASEANAIVAAALLAPGDEVLVESPGYEPLRLAPELFGARVRSFYRQASHAFGDLHASVEVALGPDTRMVVLTDLHNPSGAALDPRDLDALDALARRRGLWMVVDETFRDASSRPCGTVAARGGRWVSTSTLTKAYGLGGLRIGWIAGGPDALARCENAQNGLSVLPALTSIALAMALVPHLDALRARGRALLADNHARLAAFAAERPWCRLALPPAGTTAWLSLSHPLDGRALSERAATHFDLAVVPGHFFGEPHGVRISLGGQPERFAAALDTLDRAVASFAIGARSGGAR